MSTALFIVIGAAVALLLGFLIVVIVWQIRTHRFRPNPDKTPNRNSLIQDLKPAGFAYDRRTDTFYSLMDCWQRKMGYCRLYDEAAPGFNMIMHCEPVPFFYGGKRWLVELWKGQYGITTGGEIGVYNTTLEDVHSEKFIGTFYESISDDERLPMAFVLRKNGKPIMRRKGLHWWLTGFKLGEFSPTHTLTMDARITFPDKAMCRAFADSLRGIGYQPHEFSVRGRTAVVHYTTPHTPQSLMSYRKPSSSRPTRTTAACTGWPPPNIPTRWISWNTSRQPCPSCMNSSCTPCMPAACSRLSNG